MQILPVIDIKGGIVVRGVAGQRDAYRPLQSRWTGSHRVLDVAEAIREHFRLIDFYLADLDAILQKRPNEELYAELSRRGFRLVVDAGLTTLPQAAELFNAGAESVVAGLETLPGLSLLAELSQTFDPNRILFSLDLQNGRPLMAGEALSESRRQENSDQSALAIATAAFDAGIRRMIVLDLAAVGRGCGLVTLPLCRDIRSRLPGCRLITGGGIRGLADLQQLKQTGVEGALIASALHDGSLLPDDLLRFNEMTDP